MRTLPTLQPSTLYMPRIQPIPYLLPQTYARKQTSQHWRNRLMDRCRHFGRRFKAKGAHWGNFTIGNNRRPETHIRRRQEEVYVGLASPVTSVLAHVHGTGSIGGTAISVPDDGGLIRVTHILRRRNCVRNCSIRSAIPRGALRVALGCNPGGTGIVGNVHHVSGPNLHGCANITSVPHIHNNLNATVVSADRNIVASHSTHGRGINNRVVTCI